MNLNRNMTGLAWKVCGMKHRENAVLVTDLRPDFMGFIFYSASPRYVGDPPESGLLECLPPEIHRVGVFVNAESEFVIQTFRKYQLQFAQLHGDESPEYCAGLYREGIGLIKAFGVDAGLDLDTLDHYRKWVNYFLFDCKTPVRGGSGRQFDWGLLNDYPFDTPYFLSGGIDIDAVRRLDYERMPGLVGLDVNSRFEKVPGVKDVALLGELSDILSGINYKRLQREKHESGGR